MIFVLGDLVLIDGKPGVIRARVRASDDPRKCVPTGERYRRSGDIAERSIESYLVKVDGRSSLVWSFGCELAGRIQFPAVTRSSSNSTYEQAAAISHGTLASLTGYRETVDLSNTLRLFLQHIISAEGSGSRFDSWIAAWRWFVNGPIGDKLPAFTASDKLLLCSFPEPSTPAAAVLLRSPVGGEVLRLDSPCTTHDDAEGLAEAINTGGNLIRVGFVRRYWVGPKERDLLDRWIDRRLGTRAAA